MQPNPWSMKDEGEKRFGGMEQVYPQCHPVDALIGYLSKKIFRE